MGGRSVEVEFDHERLLDSLDSVRGYWGGSLVEYPLRSLESEDEVDEELSLLAEEVEDNVFLHVFKPSSEDSHPFRYESHDHFSPDTFKLREGREYDGSIPGIAPVYKKDILTASKVVDELWNDYEVTVSQSTDFKPIGFDRRSIPKGNLRRTVEGIEDQLGESFPCVAWYNFDAQDEITDVVRYSNGNIEVESHARNQVGASQSHSAEYFEKLSKFLDPLDRDTARTSARLNYLHFTDPQHERESELAEELENLVSVKGPTEPNVRSGHQKHI